jgi:transposase InsO family protein
MPWKEQRPMDLRKEFVLAASAPSANVTQLCRDFGISRNNGYKWIRRFEAQGELGLQDQSRRPRKTSGISGETVLRLIELRHQYPRWGAKKMQVLLIRSGHEGPPPSTKTIARILDRAGEPRVRKPRRRLRLVLREHQELEVHGPNDVWTVDFKGWWRTMDGKRFEPLTVRDAFSRYVLCLRMLPSMAAKAVQPVFERLFQAHGLPKVIRVDNGAPFACTSAPAGLSRLSAWWTSLGIRVSFSRPAHPQDNGSHERMHADMADEMEANPAGTPKAQQRIADLWRQQFNNVRPHEGIGMKTPADLYRSASRRYRGVRLPSYPRNQAVRLVTRLGCVHYAGKMVFVSESVSGFQVGVRKTRQGRLAVQFYDLHLGAFDLEASPLHHRPRLIPSHLIPKIKRASP